MNYKRLFVFFIIFVVALSLFIAAKPAGVVKCPITPETDFAFYGQTGRGGVGDLSKSWILHFLNWWKTQDPSIDYVELTSDHLKGACNLASFPNLKIYIQPGGDAYWQQRTLGSLGRSNILGYIGTGKAYLGICAGAYYAAGDYFWQGSHYDWPYLLGIYPTFEGSITDIADYDSNPGYSLTQVSSGHQMIYYGGPTRGWRDTSNVYPGQALSTYTAIPGNLPASILDNNLLLMGVHAEAYENDGITGLTTQQRTENYIWFANSINQVAGTNFYVPASEMFICGNNVCESGENWQNCSSDCLVPQCSDSLDNDMDGLIDLSDSGCTSIYDESEYDPIPSQELFLDNFESGNLEKWLVYGIGNLWTASSSSPYEGDYSAMALQSGAGEPTYIEFSFDGSSFSSLVLEYQRKLIGLDAADSFEVSYFDGSWKILEQVVSTTDPSYLYKSHVLPISATKIRFGCETGAVSEMCFVDSVKITGN